MNPERRRALALGVAFALPSRLVFAQAAPPRIGVLAHGRLEEPPLNALVRGLIERALIPGNTIVLEKPDVRGGYHEFAKMAGKLHRKVAVIVASGFTATDAARVSAPGTPLVMVVDVDPVARGLVQSLAHPGGHITGVTLPGGEEISRRLQLLKEVVPGARRLGILWSPASADEAESAARIDAMANSLGMQAHAAEVRHGGALDGAFASLAEFRADALTIVPGRLFTALARKIGEKALAQRLPTVFAGAGYVQAGGLMSCGVDFSEGMRRAAAFVERILQGANPADLPVEQSSKFELVVNMRTAGALGLSIPQSVLRRADEVIR